MTVVFWFRRDLRLQDNEALSHACSLGKVFPTYVVGERFNDLTPIRQHSLVESLRSLSADLPKGLQLLQSFEHLLGFAKQVGATRVIATKAFDTEGMLEQAHMAELLYSAGIALELKGSNYAVEPGAVRKDDGTAL
ncbi:MAG: hypothetical protein RL718_590, partial [Actinomycetota bacterium]